MSSVTTRRSWWLVMASRLTKNVTRQHACEEAFCKPPMRFLSNWLHRADFAIFGCYPFIIKDLGSVGARTKWNYHDEVFRPGSNGTTRRMGVQRGKQGGL